MTQDALAGGERGNMVRDTSIMAYEKIKKKLGDKKQAVYNVFKSHGNLSNKSVKNILGVEICEVTGRTNELVTEGYLCFKKKVRENERLVTIWGVVPQEEQSELF